MAGNGARNAHNVAKSTIISWFRRPNFAGITISSKEISDECRRFRSKRVRSNRRVLEFARFRTTPTHENNLLFPCYGSLRLPPLA